MKLFLVSSPCSKIMLIALWMTVTCDVHREADESRRHFIGYSVLRMIPSNEQEMSALKALEKKEENELDFWKAPTQINQSVDVMVSPERIAGIKQFLTDNQIPTTVLIHDVERYVLKDLANVKSSTGDISARDSDSFFRTYRSLKEIHSFIDGLNEKYSEITEILSIGKSGLNRDLKAIKIGKKVNSSKPSIFVDGTMHSREWISPATVTYIASKLVEDYDADEDVQSVVDAYDWYFLPVANPDGYEYSRSYDRLWRKSRRITSESNIFCRGVNLNRNWGFHWREGGSSPNPCSKVYAGPEAFSEPETKSISDFILSLRNNLLVYLSVHSYGQQWLTPWGWTDEFPEDYDSLVSLAQVAVSALTEVHGTKYRIGTGRSFGYDGTGASDDWNYGVAGIEYTYTVELRDTGRYGVLLPADQILPTGQETFAGFVALAKALLRRL